MKTRSPKQKKPKALKPVGRRISSQKWSRTMQGSGQGKWLRKRYTYIYIYTHTYVYICVYIYTYVYIFICTTKVDKDPRNPATDSDIWRETRETRRDKEPGNAHPQTGIYEGRQKETKGDKEPSNPAMVTQEFWTGCFWADWSSLCCPWLYGFLIWSVSSCDLARGADSCGWFEPCRTWYLQLPLNDLALRDAMFCCAFPFFARPCDGTAMWQRLCHDIG